MKLFWVLLLLAVLAVVLAQVEEDRSPKKGGHGHDKGKGHGKKSRRERFGDFRKKHRKKYKSPEEEERRMKRYNMTLNRIEKHNEEAASGKHTYTMAENHLSDTYPEEVRVMTGAIPPPRSNRLLDSDFEFDLRESTPDSVDLRNDSCMPPIKNQGRCGSCWAFAAVTPLEYQNCKKTGNMTLLSEQQLVSCSGQACSGGFYLAAFNYIKRTGGIQSAADYPYNGTTSNCTFSPEKTVVKVDSAGWVKPFYSEKAIEKALVRYGPISISIAVNENLMSYSSGVYSDRNCSTNVNHAVVVVGYGTTENGTTETLDLDYWIIRNTWGPGWGENGYFRMERGKNMCGIKAYGIWVNIK